MSTLAIIPARYASTRFPGKPLVDIRGKSMIQRVYERCQEASLVDAVGVATDDERIYAHVQSFGGQVWMTDPGHRSGTDRVAEVAAKMEAYDYLLNVQGDEPFIDPAQINLLVETIQSTSASIATLVCTFREAADLHNLNRVKVVRNREGEALYFSRAVIPPLRGTPESDWLQQHTYYQHIGLYAFKREVLPRLTQLPSHPLELAESLEQLRWLANGYPIQCALGEESGLAVDSPEDLVRLLAWLDARLG
ncbi:MAG: 3-deoxy-manno-octulosonate cytidylyltransferase [Bacteroidota bacterium]